MTEIFSVKLLQVVPFACDTCKFKSRYAMRTCVCYLEIIVGYVVLSYTVQNVGFVGFVWCHVCFAALKINETVGKKFKNLKDKVSGS